MGSTFIVDSFSNEFPVRVKLALRNGGYESHTDRAGLHNQESLGEAGHKAMDKGGERSCDMVAKL